MTWVMSDFDYIEFGRLNRHAQPMNVCFDFMGRFRTEKYRRIHMRILRQLSDFIGSILSIPFAIHPSYGKLPGHHHLHPADPISYSSF